MKILGDIRNFVFIAGVNDTGDNLFADVKEVGEIIAVVIDNGDYTSSRIFIDPGHR